MAGFLFPFKKQDADECCEKPCEEIVEPCVCECECFGELSGEILVILKYGYDIYSHPSGCWSKAYKFLSEATIACPETDEDGNLTGCGWGGLEFVNSPEQIADIQAAEQAIADIQALLVDLQDQKKIKPDAFSIDGQIADAEQGLADAKAELADLKNSENKFWSAEGGYASAPGCGNYLGDYYSPEGQLVCTVEVCASDSTPQVHAVFLDEGYQEYPAGPYINSFCELNECGSGGGAARPTGSECGCESPSSPCPEREPRYDIDVNQDGEIADTEDGAETNLCAYDEDGDGEYEYYECPPQEDCGGCMDPESSNYDPNATTDDGSCCKENCDETNPCNATSEDGSNCCCDKNFDEPTWYADTPGTDPTVCYVQDPSVQIPECNEACAPEE